MAAMTVGELFERSGLDVAAVRGGGQSLDAAVSGIAYDSRTVQGGEVFVAIKGEHLDGAAFADQARGRGAVAVVAEAARPEGFAEPWAKVTDARATLAALAAAFNGDPSHELLVVGTTGTNGKTTTTYLIEAILEQAGIRCGRVSSVSYRVASEEESAVRTTPEAPDLQALLRRMVERDCRACVMEVSSHALALKRVEQISFGAAVFTNLTRDHLDFHGDMGTYFRVKRQLFEMVRETSPAVLNVDDPYGGSLVAEVSRPVTYAIDSPADVMPDRLNLSLGGIELDARTPHGPLRLRSRLLGRANTYNILAAAATGTALAVPDRAIERGIASVEAVPGRMQLVSVEGDDVAAIVDFAHTDDALRGLLETSRSIARGRVITVFGCGGDRDTTKRPLMGTVAARLSDFVIITSDNPRSEDPERIARDIESGLGSREDRDAASGPDGLRHAGKTTWLTILDRAEAITRAIQEAQPGDLVVIAGKGHEQYQLIGTRAMPFEDTAVAREALAKRRPRSRAG